MCGIAGFLPTTSVSESQTRDVVRRMTTRMAKRGPDASGEWFGEGVALGHRRLAIIDLNPRSNQPMISSDDRFVIVFNGEIYNFAELRGELEEAGVGLRTSSDTEVILALYAREGAAMLRKLRGMFALAIWDARARELFLARDPYGIKPLYYALTPSGLLFASQVKALLSTGLIAQEREPAGWAGFYLWGSVPEPWTLYRNVFALPAGHHVVLQGRSTSRAAVLVRHCRALAGTGAHDLGGRIARAGARSSHGLGSCAPGCRRSGQHLSVRAVSTRQRSRASRRSSAQRSIVSPSASKSLPERATTKSCRRSASHSTTGSIITCASSACGVRAGRIANLRRHGPAHDRRREHLVCEQGDGRAPATRSRSPASAAMSCSAVILCSPRSRGGRASAGR